MNKEITNNNNYPWDDIKIPLNNVKRNYKGQLIRPEMSAELYWAKDSNGFISLLFNYKDPIPKIDDLSVQVLSLKIEKSDNYYELKLFDLDHKDKFYNVCENIIELIYREQTVQNLSDELIIQIMHRRTKSWVDWLKKTKTDELSIDEQKGLIGEISILKNYMLNLELTPKEAVDSWKGYLGNPKDFQINKKGIESKATETTEKPQIKISNESQLSLLGYDDVFLFVINLVRTSSGYVGAFTLPSLINEVQAQLDQLDQDAYDLFYESLIQYGYHTDDEDKYDLLWIIDTTTIYEIVDDFPKIKNEELMDGISKVRYVIDLNECHDYKVTEEYFMNVFNSNTEIQDENLRMTAEDIKELIRTKTGEDNNIEYKSTFSRKIETKELKRKDDLKTAALKTITGFINTGGGTLLIGVDEKNLSIIGIEKDDYTDNDRFLQSLSIKIGNRIGKSFHDLLDIYLVPISPSKHVCVVKCLAGNDKNSKKMYHPAPLEVYEDEGEKRYAYYKRYPNSTAEMTGEVLGTFFVNWYR